MAKKRIYYAEFRRGLEQGLQPVYVFTGAEEFLKEEGIQLILDKALPEADRSLNFESLYAGAEISGREASERAQILPFLAERRVILVRQAEKWRAADLHALITYLQNPSPATVLILSSQEERLKTADWKKLAEAAYHVECYPLFDNQVPEWVERRAKDRGKKITREAIHLLLERVGQGLADIDNELAKLMHYLGSRTVIEAADIQEVAGFTRQNTVHELNLALGKADAPAALRLADLVLAEGVFPAQILGAMVWHFRNLLDLRRRLDAGEALADIVAAQRNPQARKDLELQAKTYSFTALEGIFQELLNLDERLKTGKMHWDLFLQTTILKICNQYARIKS